MMRIRPSIQARTFGRRVVPQGNAVAATAASVGDDLKLFAMTFMGGFLFMTVYLA